MNLEELAHLATVRNLLVSISGDFNVIGKDIKKEVNNKIRELNKLFIENVLLLNTAKSVSSDVSKDLSNLVKEAEKQGGFTASPEIQEKAAKVVDSAPKKKASKKTTKKTVSKAKAKKEAELTEDQKLIAERLKAAKAQIKDKPKGGSFSKVEE